MNTAVADELRDRAHANRIPKTQIAAETGIGYRTVLRLLDGEREITVRTLSLLAQTIGTEPADILRAAEARLTP